MNDTPDTVEERGPPPLYGLVLAGGGSTRMRCDKGALDYHGMPQARYLQEMLGRYCELVFVSVNRAQAHLRPYLSLPLIVDCRYGIGPASGLLAAAAAYPGAAWLVISVDLAWLDDDTLAFLVARRRSELNATVFKSRSGLLEPFCTIWEPSSLLRLAARVEQGDGSPRRCLEAAAAHVLDCPSPKVLQGVNSRAEKEAWTPDGG